MSSLRKGKYIYVIGLIFLLSIPLAAFAAGKDFVIANVRVRPTLDVSSEYQTNINLEDSNEDESMVIRVTPGLSFQVPLERTYLELGGDLSYVKAESGDETTSAHARGLMRYNLSNQTSLGLSHDYTRGELYGVTSDNYNLHQSRAMIKSELSPRLAVTLDGGMSDYHNRLENISIYTDYDDYSGAVTLDYKLSRMTGITLSGKYMDRDYKDTETKDYDSWSYGVGVSNRITPKITVGLKGGYTSRDYEWGDDVSLMTYGGDLNIRLSNFSTLSINYDYDIQDTFYSREATALKTGFDGDNGLLDLLDEHYKFMKTHNVSANLTYNLTDKDTITLGAGYMNSESGQEAAGSASGTRLDEENYFGGIGYSRKLASWIALNLKFVYGQRDSNTRNDYDYKTTSAGLSIAF